MVEYWVEEVLFRGRPPSGPNSELPPRLYVVMGVQEEQPDLLNPQLSKYNRQLTSPMTFTQATENFGYDASGLVAQINSQAFAEVERLSARVQELEQALEDKEEVVESVTEEF